MFGPSGGDASVNRPFGDAAVDGFDFDFESTVQNMVPFASKLRALMDADQASSGKQWLLTAAPQCVYPDAADGEMLNGAIFFDAIWIQFYNNFCGLPQFVVGSTTQNNFNYNVWDTWATTVSKNPNVKLFLGIPGNTGAAGSGYETGTTLAAIIAYCKTFGSFGGVMMWDMTQVFNNNGFLSAVSASLGEAGGSGGGGGGNSTTSAIPTTLQTMTKTATSTAVSTTSTSTTGGSVAQWGQCGGTGYSGATTCASPYSCVSSTAYWSQCQ